MFLKYIGAVFIIIGCGGFGLMITCNHKKEQNNLGKLISALDFMGCELQYRMSALPELCRITAAECDQPLRKIFSQLAIELEDQISPDVQRCMEVVLARCPELPSQTTDMLHLLGTSLGRFDLDGQLKGLEHVRQECRVRLNKLSNNAEVRLRSYQTLGLCAGAALVILLM